MGAVSEMLAKEHAFEHEGRKYTCSLITQDIKSAWERRQFGRAKEAAAAMRDLMDKAEYSAHLKQLADDYMAGEYALESDRGVEAVSRTPGMVMLLSLLFNVPEDEALRLVKQRQEDVTALVRLVFRESYAMSEEDVAEAEAEGKKKAPAG